MTIDLNAVREAIEGTRAGLDAAGYSIACAEAAGRLQLTIAARDGACEDCLVPKPVFTSIVQRELDDKGIRVEAIDVIYPVEIPDELN
jgi:hypothetical protein